MSSLRNAISSPNIPVSNAMGTRSRPRSSQGRAEKGRQEPMGMVAGTALCFQIWAHDFTATEVITWQPCTGWPAKSSGLGQPLQKPNDCNFQGGADIDRSTSAMDR